MSGLREAFRKDVRLLCASPVPPFRMLRHENLAESNVNGNFTVDGHGSPPITLRSPWRKRLLHLSGDACALHQNEPIR